MSALDWPSIGLGICVGFAVATLYLAGLAYGIRLALRSRCSTLVLLCSAGVRIALLLAVGVALARHDLAAFFGFTLGFLTFRAVIVAVISAPTTSGTR